MGKKSIKQQIEEMDMSMLVSPDALDYVKSMSDESLEGLLVAIVEVAWQDLLNGSIYLKGNPIENIRKASAKQIDSMVKVNDSRHFFESDWFNDITKGNVNPDWVFGVLKKTLDLERSQMCMASNLIKKRLKSAIIY